MDILISGWLFEDRELDIALMALALRKWEYCSGSYAILGDNGVSK